MRRSFVDLAYVFALVLSVVAVIGGDWDKATAFLLLAILAELATINSGCST